VGKLADPPSLSFGAFGRASASLATAIFDPFSNGVTLNPLIPVSTPGGDFLEKDAQ
jgi:hypothetical protein